MKKLLMLTILLISIDSFSQDVGRIRQSTTLIIHYKVLPNHVYDIFVQNAHRDTSVIKFVYNDTSYSVRLGNWEKYRFVVRKPDGFTLWARNMSYKGQPEDLMECGSKRSVDKITEKEKKSSFIKIPCNEVPIRIIRTIPTIPNSEMQ